jgi:MFS family permease
LTRLQWTILLVAWLGWVFDVMDTALFNFAKVPMMTEMLGPERYKLEGPRIEGQVQTWFLIGWAIGGLVFGMMADRWGRTRTLIVTILTYCCLTGLTALCRTPEQVMVARFLTALGIGGEWAAGAALIAESMPDSMRAKASSLLQTAAAIGPVLAALANFGLAHASWRMLFLVGIAPAFLCFVIRSKVPEPERKSGQTPTGNAISMLRELFGDPKLRRNTIVAMAIGVVGVTGAGIVPFWIPNLVKEASAGLGEVAIRTRTSDATMAIHVGTLLGVFCFPALAERIGRKRSFAIFFVLSPAATALALAGGADYTRLLLLLPISTFFSIGVSAGFVLYFPELFPSRLRATGCGLGYNVGRIFSAPIPWLTGILIGALNGSATAGVLIAACIYLIGLLTLPFAPETKGQGVPA